jgi:hypothetical protein
LAAVVTESGEGPSAFAEAGSFTFTDTETCGNCAPPPAKVQSRRVQALAAFTAVETVVLQLFRPSPFPTTVMSMVDPGFAAATGKVPNVV